MEPMVGQIELFAFSFAPVGFLPCNGQLQNMPATSPNVSNVRPNAAACVAISLTVDSDGRR